MCIINHKAACHSVFLQQFSMQPLKIVNSRMQFLNVRYKISAHVSSEKNTSILCVLEWP